MEYDTVPAEAKKLEDHKLYYEVQCVAFGIERVEVAPLEGLACAKEYDEADDYALFESPMPATSVVLHAGEIAVLPPEDAHKPGCIAAVARVHVKKVVLMVSALPGGLLDHGRMKQGAYALMIWKFWPRPRRL